MVISLKQLHRQKLPVKTQKTKNLIIRFSKVYIENTVGLEGFINEANMSETSAAAIRFDNRVDIMCWAIFGKRKVKEGPPIGSEGLGIKPSEGEISTSGMNRVVVSSAISNNAPTLALSSRVISNKFWACQRECRACTEP